MQRPSSIGALASRPAPANRDTASQLNLFRTVVAAKAGATFGTSAADVPFELLWKSFDWARAQRAAECVAGAPDTAIESRGWVSAWVEWRARRIFVGCALTGAIGVIRNCSTEEIRIACAVPRSPFADGAEDWPRIGEVPRPPFLWEDGARVLILSQGKGRSF